MTEDKSHGVCGIVRNREREYTEIADLKFCPTGKKIPVGHDPGSFQRVGGEGIGKNRHGTIRAKNTEPLRMVAVLVGEKHACKGVGLDTMGIQMPVDSFCAQSDVDQDSSLSSLQQGDISSAAAGYNGDAHDVEFR